MSASAPATPTAFTEASLRAHIAATPELAQQFGGVVDDLSVTEIGDGNLNFVFFVRGSHGALAIKQALPWSRMSKGARALTSERLAFETRALQIFAEFAPAHVPHIHHYDAQNSLMAQTFLSPHIILRKGLMAGQDYPLLAEHISTFLANCLYGSSAMAMAPARRRPLVACFAANTELCEITERLVFTHPFEQADSNRWTSPQLDAQVAALQANGALQMRVRDLKLRFLTKSQALLHGDLHSGSIMLTATDTRVIDPEFATFGPMGFDIGMLLGNLLLAHFAQPAHNSAAKPQILHLIHDIWQGFAAKFRALALAGPGLLSPPQPDRTQDYADLRAGWVDAFLADVLEDTIDFAAIEMIRRTIGAAHVAEFEEITDADLRARCESAVLDHATALLTRKGAASGISVLTAGR